MYVSAHPLDEQPRELEAKIEKKAILPVRVIRRANTFYLVVLFAAFGALLMLRGKTFPALYHELMAAHLRTYVGIGTPLLTKGATLSALCSFRHATIVLASYSAEVSLLSYLLGSNYVTTWLPPRHRTGDEGLRSLCGSVRHRLFPQGTKGGRRAWDAFWAGGSVHQRGTDAKLGQEIPLLLVIRPKSVQPASFHVWECVAVSDVRLDVKHRRACHACFAPEKQHRKPAAEARIRKKRGMRSGKKFSRTNG